MNIIYIVDKFPHGKSAKTGKYPFIYNEMIKRGHNVIMIAYNAEKSNIFRILSKKTDLNSVVYKFHFFNTLINILKPLFVKFVNFNSFEKYIANINLYNIQRIIGAKNVLKQFDLIHVWGEDRQLIGIRLGIFLKEKYNGKLVWNFHGSSTLDLGNDSKRLNKIKAFTTKCEYLLPVSSVLKNYIQDKFHSILIKVVHNPLDTDFFVPKIKEKHNDTINIFHISKLDKNKNVPAILRAVGVLKNLGYHIKFKLAGSSNLDAELDELIIDLQLNSKILFLGKLSMSEVREEYYNADVYVQSSIIETFCYPIAEALACGTPVVTTPSGGPRDIIKNNYAIMTKDFKHESIAEAIIEIVNKKNFQPPSLMHDKIKSVCGKNKVFNDLEQVYNESSLIKKSN